MPVATYCLERVCLEIQFQRLCQSATFVAHFTCSLNASNDNLLRHPLGVRGKTQEAHEVYEGGGEVEPAAELTGGVVEGERVMVVMEAFTYGTDSDQWVFPGVDGLIIWSVAPYVCSTVHQPGSVENQSVPQQPGYKVSNNQGLPPEVPGHQHGHEEAEDHHRELVVPKMEREMLFLISLM